MKSRAVELLALARELAIEAGELAARRRREGVSVATTKSSPVDIVTATDREVEAFIRARIAQQRPGDGFLGEESDATESQSGITWVVDPIDGTVNFLYGIPAWAVSIAAVEGPPRPDAWHARAACVVNPVLGEVYTAADGAGARLGDEPLFASLATQLDQSLIGTGFSYDANQRVEQAGAVTSLLGRVRDIRRMGSAALDLCSVAAGRLDGYFERGLNPWDHAAGALIAAEAGAVVTMHPADATGRELIVAMAPGVAEPMDAALKVIGA